MQVQLVDLLRYLEIGENYFPYFHDAEITEAILNKNTKETDFYLEFPEIIDVSLLEKLFTACKNKGDVFHPHLQFKDCALNDLVVNAYYSFMINFYYGDLPIKNSLTGIKLAYQNEKIVFPLTTKIQHSLFLSMNEELQNHFQAMGLPCLLEFILDEKSILDVKTRIEEEKEDERRQILRSLEEKEQDILKKKLDDNPFKDGFIGKDALRVTLSTIQDTDQNVYFYGRIFSKEEIKRRNGSSIFVYMMTDDEDSITAKCMENRFLKLEQFQDLPVDGWFFFLGKVEYDAFARDNVFIVQGIAPADAPAIAKDTADEKRVELHLHTKMSTMDAVTSITDYVNRAIYWGQPAIAVTDHASVQAFPELQKACKGKPIKPIYGLEAYMIDDRVNALINESNQTFDEATYVFFDLETTGLSARYDKIIEFGAVKTKNGMEIDRYQCFINPKMKIPEFTTTLTGITDQDVMNAPTIEVALKKITKFIEGCVLVAHNANFDFGFMDQVMKENGYGPLTNATLDTLALSRLVFPTLKSFSLGNVSNHLAIAYDDESAHRADYDAWVLRQVYEYIYAKLVETYHITHINDLKDMLNPNFMKTSRPHHTTLLVKNNAGLNALYQLVSRANIDYLGDYPLLPRKLIEEKRQDLLVGSACFNGEIFDIASTRNEDVLLDAMAFYDYIEVQPIDNYSYLVDTRRVASYDIIKRTIEDMVAGAKKLGKIVVATSDCHYLEPKIKIARDIYISSLSVGNRAHPLYDYRGRVQENPNQHFRSTSEMLQDMSFLGDTVAKEIVVTNTNLIASMIQGDIFPIKDQLFYPIIENSEEEVKRLCYTKAKELYGDPLPMLVLNRIDREVKSILDNKFSVIYYIAHRLVKMSHEQGYLVGSRGSVGSSLAATLMDITEVNPLPPHYLCPNCKHSEFFEDGSIASGFDLPDQNCPVCGTKMKGDGQNIQFETFLGFKGDKVPDIDLNFSSEFQATAHNYTKVLLGEYNVLRAGTISTVAEKTAFGYVAGYFEKHPHLKAPRKAEKARLANLCKDVKKTTGQHPGGIIVIPQYLDIYDITPIQYPADQVNSAWKTSHFDYHAIHDEVLKLDLLGHVDPSAIRLLQNVTGVDPLSIPLNDEKVYSLFYSSDALGIENYQSDFVNAAAGLPEFGTNNVRRMLDETQPKKFSELVQISGLSHGTDVWYGNAQALIASGELTLMECIGCRDDIMLYLIQKGLPPLDAFKIMEDVRKGKKVKPEFEAIMLAHNVPKWYIDSCNKIKYMFPKAHAVAYVMMAYRIAWFKIYYPLAYYASYFTLRCDAYEIETLVKGKNAIKDRLEQLRVLLKDRSAMMDSGEKENKVKSLEPVLEVAMEMSDRGYHFAPISLERSLVSEFLVDEENKALIPPFTTIDGLGASVAESIIEARKERPFISKDDLQARTSVSGTILQTFEKLGITKGLQEHDQLQFLF